MFKKISKFFDNIDLGKKYPKYINKNIFRFAFLIILIIQITALTMTGFNLSPVWVECQLNESSLQDYCENPFYRSTGGFCKQDYLLCSKEKLSRGEIIGNKPPAFVFMANPLSWFILIMAGFSNHIRYRTKKYYEVKNNGKRI